MMARRKIAGIESSVLGFGAAPIGNLYTAVTDAEAASAVDCAWERGIRYFDTAPYYGYGLSEQRLGRALSHRPRDSFVLSTKVGRCLHEAAQTRSGDGFAVTGRSATFDYTREGVRRSVESSLARLRTDHIEILLLHDIGALTHGAQHSQILRQALDQALPEMTRLKEEGICRAVGIGVNEREVCLELMPRFPLDCLMLAGRYTLLEQSMGLEVMDAAVRHGVEVIVGGPYNSGLLSDSRAPGDKYDYGPANAVVRSQAARLYKLCEQAKVDVGAAALQFPLAHAAVTSVVAGMRSKEEVDCAIVRMNTAVPPSLWRRLRDASLVVPGAPTP